MATTTARSALNHLIETCHDAEHGFLNAAGLVADPSYQALFTQLASERAQFASQLLPFAQRLGGPCASDGTTAASLHRHWMELKQALVRDDLTVLNDVRRGDSVTARAYEEAVAQLLPADVRDIVEHQDATIRRSHKRLQEL
jgi:uncharacterized protein (TIGR02284 family)